MKVYNCTEDSGVVTDTKGGRMHMIPVIIDPITLKTLFPEPLTLSGSAIWSQDRGTQGVPEKDPSFRL